MYESQPNSTEFEPYLEVTPLRKDPDYAIYYNNWTRLAVLGIVPFALLVYFNTKIYKDIQVSLDVWHIYREPDRILGNYLLLFFPFRCSPTICNVLFSCLKLVNPREMRNMIRIT